MKHCFYNDPSHRVPCGNGNKCLQASTELCSYSAPSPRVLHSSMRVGNKCLGGFHKTLPLSCSELPQPTGMWSSHMVSVLMLDLGCIQGSTYLTI